MTKETHLETVPQALKTWFVIHFVLDMVFAIPMMAAPVFTLELLGWRDIHPMTTRLVAAALFGIGIESFLGRNAGIEAYQGMLNLKIIWSLGAILGITLSLIEDIQGWPFFGWVVLLIFIFFNFVWGYWRWRLR
jgi:hypothetical protein